MPSSDSVALAAYVASRGGHVNSSLDLLSPSAVGGRGVLALQDIKKGENLVFVPIDACLFVPKKEQQATSASKNSTPAALFLRDYCEGHGIPPFAAAVALLLAEIAAGEGSPHAPFIASLPFGGAVVDDNDVDADDKNQNDLSPPLTKCLDCTLVWRPQELRLLDGTSAHDEGGGARNMYEKVMLPLFELKQKFWPAPFNSFAAFNRAACLVQSRAFHLRATNWATGATSDDADGGTLYLIPAIDQVNHGSTAKERSTALERVSTAATATATETKTDATDASSAAAVVDCFCMKADRDIRKGEEVFHGYGDSLSDAELLTTYGFVPRSRKLKRDDDDGDGNSGDDIKEELSENPCNRAALPSELLVEAAIAVASGRKKKGGGGKGARGVAERAEALASAGALGGDFSVSSSDPMPDALFGAAALLCLGRVAGDVEDDDGEEDEGSGAEALWEEAKDDLLSVARALGPEEAIESAPEIAYSAALALERAASRALEALGERGGGGSSDTRNDDDVFKRRAALAEVVRKREAGLLRLLRRSAVEAAAAAAEAMAEEDEEEEEGEGDEEEDEDRDGAQEAKSKNKRAAAPSEENNDEKPQRRARK